MKSKFYTKRPRISGCHEILFNNSGRSCQTGQTITVTFYSLLNAQVGVTYSYKRLLVKKTNQQRSELIGMMHSNFSMPPKDKSESVADARTILNNLLNYQRLYLLQKH